MVSYIIFEINGLILIPIMLKSFPNNSQHMCSVFFEDRLYCYD